MTSFRQQFTKILEVSSVASAERTTYYNKLNGFIFRKIIRNACLSALRIGIWCMFKCALPTFIDTYENRLTAVKRSARLILLTFPPGRISKHVRAGIGMDKRSWLEMDRRSWLETHSTADWICIPYARGRERIKIPSLRHAMTKYRLNWFVINGINGEKQVWRTW